MPSSIYESRARHREARGWWLRDHRGGFVPLGCFARGDAPFDRTLTLPRGRYTLGCGPAGRDGVRKTIVVGPTLKREGPPTGDGHFVVSDRSGAVSLLGEVGCVPLLSGLRTFECAVHGARYRVRGHSVQVCHNPDLHEVRETHGLRVTLIV